MEIARERSVNSASISDSEDENIDSDLDSKYMRCSMARFRYALE